MSHSVCASRGRCPSVSCSSRSGARSSSRLVLAAGLCASTLLDAPAYAVNREWLSGSSGFASNINNWNPPGLVGASDDLLFNILSSYTVTWDAFVPQSRTQTYRWGTVTLALNSPHTILNGFDVTASVSPATMILQSGQLNANASSDVGFAGVGLLRVTGPFSDLLLNGAATDLRIGGTGTLEVLGGGFVRSDDDVIFGSSTDGAKGLVSGVGFTGQQLINSDLVTTGTNADVIVGSQGNALLEVLNGGYVASGDDIFANAVATSGDGEIRVSGTSGAFTATIAAEDDLFIGAVEAGQASGPHGLVTLENTGRAIVGDTTFLGVDGTLVIDGGFLSTGSLDIDGALDFRDGWIEVVGGVMSTPGAFTVQAATATEQATLRLRDGAIFNLFSNTFTAGDGVGLTGHVEVLGSNGAGPSTLRVSGGVGSSDVVIGDLGDATITVESGGLVEAGDDFILANGLDGIATAYVEGVAGGHRSTVRTLGSNTTSDIFVGLGASSLALLEIFNGALVEADRDVRLGGALGAYGEVTIGGASGGFNAELHAGDDLMIGVTEVSGEFVEQFASDATLTVNAGGTVTVADTLAAGAGDAIEVNGGTIIAGHLRMNGGTLDINTGLVSAVFDQSVFVNTDVTIQNGTLTAFVDLRFAGGHIVVNGPSALLEATPAGEIAGRITVGALDNLATTLDVTGGARVSVFNALHIGSAPTTDPSVIVNVSGVSNGVRSMLDVAEDLAVNYGSTASLHVSNGALVQVGEEMNIGGLNAGGTSSVTVGGASGGFNATIDVLSGGLAIGTGFPSGSSPGLLTINAGGSVMSGFTWLGGDDDGELRMTGGTLFTHDLIADGGANTITTFTGGTATVDGGTLTYDASGPLALNGTSTSNRAVFVVQNGAQGTSADSILVGDQAGRFGTLTVTGAASGTPTLLTMGAGALLHVGDDGNGILNVTSGGRIHSPENILIGANAGSSGTATVSGSNGSLNSTLRTTGGFDDIVVGASGTGTLTASSRGLVQAADQIIIGRNSGGVGTATVTGVSSGVRSTLRTSGVSGSSHVIVGQSGQGTLNVQSGALVEATHDVILGESAGGVGTATVGGSSGGFSSELRAHDDLLIGANDAGANGGVGVVNLDASGLVNVTDDTVVGNGDTLDIDGGTFNTADLFLQPGATFSQSAGVVNVSGLTTDRASNAVMTGGTYNALGDFIIGLGSKDNASFTVTGATSDMFASGVLVAGVQGSGTLSVLNGGFVQANDAVSAGDSPGSLGSIVVSGVSGGIRSTLDANASVVIAPGDNGSMTVSNGALVDIVNNLLIGGVVGADGVVTVGGTSGGFNSNLFVGQDVGLGGSAGQGSLTLDTFSFVTVGDTLFAGFAGSRGTYTINAGSLTTTSLLADDGANSVLNLNGGNTTVDGGTFAYDGAISLGLNGASNSSRAVLNLQDGAQGTSADSILVGDLAARFGTLNVTGFADAAGDRGATPTTLTLTGSALLHIGDDGDGVLNVANSAVVQGPNSVRIGANTGSNGVAVVTGAGSRLQTTGSSGDLLVGGSGAGDLTISSLGQVLIGDDISIGTSSNGVGFVEVVGASGGLRSTIRTTGVSTTSDFTVGGIGQGTLDVDDGALAQSHRDFRIGDSSTGSGVATVGGFVGGFSSSILVGDDLLIGASESFTNTGVGVLNLDSLGLVQVADDTIVGAGDTLDIDGGTFGTTDLHLLSGATYAQSAGAANVSGLTSVRTTGAMMTGGTFNASDDFRIATTAGDLGLFTVTGASADLLLGPSAVLRVGQQGTGMLDVLAGGRVDAQAAVIIGEGSNTAGVLTVSGVSGVRSSLDAAGDVTAAVNTNSIGGLHVLDGALVTIGDELIVGGALGSHGGVRVDGQAGGWSAELNVGNSVMLGSASGGSGQLIIDHGGLMTVANEVRLGFILGAGELTIRDGSLTTGSLFATQGLLSDLNLSGGALIIDGGDLFWNAAEDLIISNASVGLHATMTMRNGADGVVHDTLRVASGPGPFQSGDLILEGPGVTLDIVDGAALIIGDTGDGDLSITGGAQLEVLAGSFIAANSTSSESHILVSGATAQARSSLRVLSPAAENTLIRHGTGSVSVLDGALVELNGSTVTSGPSESSATSALLIDGVSSSGHRSTLLLDTLHATQTLGATDLTVSDGALVSVAATATLTVGGVASTETIVGGAMGGFDSEFLIGDALNVNQGGSTADNLLRINNDGHVVVGGAMRVGTHTSIEVLGGSLQSESITLGHAVSIAGSPSLLHVDGGDVTIEQELLAQNSAKVEILAGHLEMGSFRLRGEGINIGIAEIHVTGGEVFAANGGTIATEVASENGRLIVEGGQFESGGSIHNDGQIEVDGFGSYLRIDGAAPLDLVNGTIVHGSTAVINGGLLDVSGDVVLGSEPDTSGLLFVQGEQGNFPFTTRSRVNAANLVIGDGYDGLLDGEGGEGEAVIRAGALVTVADDVLVGARPGGVGLLEVSGAGLEPSTLDIGGSLVIGGIWGMGTVNLTDGAVISGSHYAFYELNGSTFNIDGGALVGFYSWGWVGSFKETRGGSAFNFRDGVVAVNGGEFVWDGMMQDLVISGADAGDNAQFQFLDGATTDIDGSIVFGAAPARRGSVLVDGVGPDGPSTLSTNAGATITIGSSGVGEAIVSSGGHISSANQITLAQAAGSEADVTIGGVTAGDRSTIRTTANTDIVVGAAGIASLTIANGGLLEARDDVILADSASGRAFVEVNGVTKGSRSTLRSIAGSSTPDVFVGRSGIADLDILSGALVSSARDTVVGALGVGSGHVTVSGSQGKHRSELLVGDDLLLGATEFSTSTGAASLHVFGLGRVAVTDDTVLGANAALVLGDAEFHTAGFRMLSGAEATINEDGFLSTVDFDLDAGADFNLLNGTLEIRGGTIAVDHNTGLVDGSGRLVLDGDSAGGFATALLRLESNSSLNVTGALIGVQETGVLEILESSDVIASGDVLLGMQGNNARGTVHVAGQGSTMSVAGDVYLGGDAALPRGAGHLVVESQGLFAAGPSSTIVLYEDSSIDLAGGEIRAGLIDLRENSNIKFPSTLSGHGVVDAAVVSDGIITSSGPGLQFLHGVDNMRLVVSDSTSTSIDGGLINSGTVRVGGALTIAGGVVNSGELLLDGEFATASIIGGVLNTGEIDIDGGSALLTIANGVINGFGQGVTGDGQITFADGGGFTGSGVFGSFLNVRALAGSVISATGNLTLGALDSGFGFRTDGELHVGAHAVRLRDNNDIELNGLATLAGGSLERSGAGNDDLINFGVIEGFGTLGGDIDNAAGGVIRGFGAGLVFADSVHNNGVIEGDLVILDNGSTMSKGGATYATQFINRGEINGGISVMEGTLLGRGQGVSGELFINDLGSAFLDGAVDADVLNRGRLEIESITRSTSVLFVDEFNQQSAGTVAFDLASATAYDRLVITGPGSFSTLGGAVEVRLADAFMPIWGHRFVLIDAVDGFFQTTSLAFDLPMLADANLRWQPLVSGVGVWLDVRHNADINGDNMIGFADFNVILSFFNAPGDYSMGDVTGDGFVGFEDLNYVLSFFNTAAPGLVPTPGAAALALIGLGATVGRRGRVVRD